MARKMDLKLREEWRQRIKRQRKSGLTVAEFCRREGVSSASFYLWRQKLQGKSRSKPKRKTTQKPSGTRVMAVDPVPKVPSESAFVQLPVSRANTCPWIELVLAEGTIIRIPQQNLTALETVLHALGSVSRSPFQGETRHA